MMKLFLDLPTPSNINYMWNFGSLMGVNLFLQIFTGLFLSFQYVSCSDLSFDSLYYIMMEVNSGWFVRLMHMNGASMFFVLCYIHVGRSLYYGGYMYYKVWFSGVLMLLLLFMIAFLGYVLPWGQMSLWGATVITKLISVLPYFGKCVVEWVWGGYSVNSATLVRFFSLHFVMPFVLLFMVFVHLFFLHENGSNNPVTNFNNLDKINFHPYFTFKDVFGLVVFMFFFFVFVNLYSNFFADTENFIMSNNLVTPNLIKPEWYFLFAYAILRSVPNKMGGVVSLVMSILLLFFLPLLDFSSIKKNNYYPFLSLYFFFFVSVFFMLTFCGSMPVEWPYYFMGQVLSFMYFFYMMSFSLVKFFADTLVVFSH